MANWFAQLFKRRRRTQLGTARLVGRGGIVALLRSKLAARSRMLGVARFYAGPVPVPANWRHFSDDFDDEFC